MNGHKRPRVVIVGAGFGGLNAAKVFKNAPVDVMIIDRNNYHLFQPLLYQVATAGVSATEIAYPVRAIFRNQKNVTFCMAKVFDVDFKSQTLDTEVGLIPYDYLILAMGSENNFFGMESVAENAYGLKDLNEARDIRNHILWVFERSTRIDDPALCEAMRTFVIVGGGPTGVEMSGALSELIRLELSRDYPQLTYESVHVILLEMLDQLLPGFPPDLAERAQQMLKNKHVEVRLNTAVSGYDGQVVTLKNGETIPAETLIWAAGVKTEDLAGRLGLEQAKQGRIVVKQTLQTRQYANVFVIGDAAFLEDGGGPLPMVAPVAIQESKTAAENILHMLRGQQLEEFQYNDPGSLATIGRNAAIARVGRFKFSGFFAWIVWLWVHLFWLIGFRNRLIVLINWAWDYFLYDRAVRLITPAPSVRFEQEMAVEEELLSADGKTRQA